MQMKKVIAFLSANLSLLSKIKTVKILLLLTIMK